MLLNLATFLVALAAPVMLWLEVYFGYNFSIWSYVGPVSVALALFLAVIIHTLQQED